LTYRIESLENLQTSLESNIADMKRQINNLKVENEIIKQENKDELLSRDLYSKRLNYLVYGMKEIAWETREQTEAIFKQFCE